MLSKYVAALYGCKITNYFLYDKKRELANVVAMII